jgi:hypothetical protein
MRPRCPQSRASRQVEVSDGGHCLYLTLVGVSRALRAPIICRRVPVCRPLLPVRTAAAVPLDHDTA